MSIKIKKRDGSLEELNHEKYHNHVEHAVKGIDNVSASEIEFAAKMNIVDGIRSSEIQKALIMATSDMIMDNPNYDKPAARLLNQDLRKEVFGDYEPKDLTEHIINNINENIYDRNYLNRYYTDEEIRELIGLIDLDKDDNFSYAGLKKNTDGYLIKKYGKIKETPQEAYLLIGMFAFAKYKEKYNSEVRRKWVNECYKALSDYEISLPTPVISKLRTTFRNFISCVLIPLGDTKMSISNANKTILLVVASGSGIGLDASDIRGLGADIDNGRMQHVGAFPIIKASEKTTKAFVQPDRDGSTTTFYLYYNREILEMMTWGNTKGTADTRARDMDHAIKFNYLFFERYKNNEDITLFFTNDVPLLKTCAGEPEKFKKLYEEYERTVPEENQVKIPASVIFDNFLSEVVLQSREYAVFMDAFNKHSSFDVPLNQSNLCVTGDTKILTKEYGNAVIGKLVERGNTDVTCWNGEEWSETKLFKTSEGQTVWKVILSDDIELEVTPYHKWYILEDGVVVEKRTAELRIGDIIEDYKIPLQSKIYDDCEISMLCTKRGVTVMGIINENKKAPTYCGTEPKRNKLIFNGVLTGNCLEIGQPTFPLESDYIFKRNIEFKSEEDKEKFYKIRKKMFTLQSTKQKEYKSLNKKLNKHFEFTTIDMSAKVDESKPYDYFDLNGNIALDETGVCILGGINVGNTKEERLPIVIELLVRLLDEIIDYNEYMTPYMEKAAKMRRGLGIGFSDIFHDLAKNKVKYNTKEGMELVNRKLELITYHGIKTSIQLAKDFGPCLLNKESKYSKGILPIDTYEKHVDDLVEKSPLGLDWLTLRRLANKYGTRHSSLFANAPFGNSSLPSNSTPGIEPPRDLIGKKSGLPKVVPEYDKYKEYYTTAWSDEFNNIDYFKFTAVIQKWMDQALSLNRYHDLRRYENEKIPKSLFLEETLVAYYYGHKTLYYLNIKSKDKVNKNEELLLESHKETIKLKQTPGECSGGSCSI